MDFRFTREQDQWCKEVRAIIQSLITPELETEMQNTHDIDPDLTGEK